MKRRIVFVVVLIALLVPNARADLATKAKRFVAMLQEQNYEGAVASFDAKMTKVMPSARLKGTWEELLSKLGSLKGITAVKEEKIKSFDMVVLTGNFEKTAFDIKVVFDGRQRIAGLFFAPAKTKVRYSKPTYVHQNRFTEREVVVDVGSWPLPGTLTIPKGTGPFPAVVLVHGSGPNDRDETLGPNKPFRDIAWGLASQGIAVLRYDKRTMVHGAKVMAQIASFTADDIVVDDAVAAAKLLMNFPEVDGQKVFLLGHSLGGMMAPRIATRAPFLAGIIILAGLARDLADTLLDQYTYIFNLDGAVSPPEQKKLDEVNATIRKIKTLTPKNSGDSEILIMGCADFWLDLRKYNPPSVAKSLDMKILVLQGGRDYQVTSDDWRLWATALHGKPNVRARKYGKLNHLFFEGYGPCTPNEYQTQRSVEPYVIKDIVSWVLSGHLTPQ